MSSPCINIFFVNLLPRERHCLPCYWIELFIFCMWHCQLLNDLETDSQTQKSTYLKPWCLIKSINQWILLAPSVAEHMDFFLFKNGLGLNAFCAEKTTRFLHLYLASASGRMMTPDAVAFFFLQKTGCSSTFLSRILFASNTRSGFVQSIHRGSCNLRWRLKSNPIHGIAVSCF